VCSLIPSATEIIFGLGLGDSLFGVSHECDFPPEARLKPKLTKSLIDASRSGADINAQVVESLKSGNGLYDLDVDALRNASPDVILTQRLCTVCAVSYSQVYRAAKSLPTRPKIVTLEPSSLDDVLSDILKVGRVMKVVEKANELVRTLETRRKIVSSAAKFAEARPRVLCLEWLDPPFVAGHWIPEMVNIAGGIDELAAPHKPSSQISWDRILLYKPEVMILMPCGFDLRRTTMEARVLSSFYGFEDIQAATEERIYATDANSYFSRSGPRLFDSLEVLLSMIHPELASTINSRIYYKKLEVRQNQAAVT
jgi:iron complex transport system substrate-binding protein